MGNRFQARGGETNRRRLAIAIAAAVAALAASPAGAAVYRVGVGAGGCTHATLSAALAAAAATPEADTILLTRSVTYTNVQLSLINWSADTTGSLTLQGGFDTCGSPAASGVTTLSGTGSAPVIEIGTVGEFGSSRVELNHLDLTGGTHGLAVSGDSLVDLRSSVVRGNSGGGVRVAATSRLTIDHRSTVGNNTGAASGGGIDCIGPHSRVTLFGIVTNNQATLRGGGISAGDKGAAAHVTGGGSLRLVQGFVEENGGPGEAGYALVSQGSDSLLWVDGVQLWNNRTEALFRAENAGRVLAFFVSAARNDYLAGGPPYLPSRGAEAVGGATVAIGASILVDQAPFVTATGGEVGGTCLLVDTAAGLTFSTGMPMVGVDPRFVDREGGNLRLRLDSPALDSCEEVAGIFPRDYDLDPRGFALPFVADVLGPYDRGADELVPFFFDGFESGDTSAWSSTVP